MSLLWMRLVVGEGRDFGEASAPGGYMSFVVLTRGRSF